MKKRIFALMIIFVLAFLSFPYSYASGFCQNADAIEEATKSVLMLYVYDSQDQLIATGSGFCAINNNTLITNFHVIEDGRRVVAASDEGETYSINKLFCVDKNMDIAILGFENPTGLFPLPLKPDNQLKRGSAVVAIGSPKGLINTVSIGNISAQFEEDGILWIQFTAPISNGSSGGALFNDEGQVIGVTSAAYRDAQNLNFAINIAVAQAMYNAWDGITYGFDGYKSSARMDFSNVYNPPVSQQVNNTKEQAEEWVCPNCGTHNATKFCSECGTEKPIWICACGKVNNGKFCGYCGRSLAEMITEINNSFSLLEINQYEEAISILKELEQFNCVSIETAKGKNISAFEQMQAAYYQLAENSKETNADIETIVTYYQKAEGYLDSDIQIRKVYYEEGLMLLNNKQYSNAIESFKKAGDYSDAEEQIKNVFYQQGLELLENAEYDRAISLFSIVNDYRDAEQKIYEANQAKLAQKYETAEKIYSQRNYTVAATLFAEAKGYLDAEMRELQCYYERAKQLLDAEKYFEANQYFKKAGSFSDAAYWASEATVLQIQNQVQEIDHEEPSNMLAQYDTLLNTLSNLKDGNEHAANLYKELSYESGLIYLEKGAYETAKSHFMNAEDFKDAKEQIKKVYYYQGLSAFEKGLFDNAKACFLKAQGFLDSQEKITEVDQAKFKDKYAVAEKAFSNKDFASAAKEFAAIKGYSDAETRELQCYYEIAEQHVAGKRYYAAIKYFKLAGIYSDAQEKIHSTRIEQVNYLISKGEYLEANEIVIAENASEKPLGEFKVLSVGDKKSIVNNILAIAKGMEYLESYPKDENEYKAKYENGVKRIEKALNMTVDGVITLSEMIVLNNLIYPSKEGPKVKDLLEKLSDLEYLSALPDSHSKYDSSRYMNGVKKAEKALGLQADGLITEEEYNTIMKQRVIPPDPPKNIKISVSEANVTLSWSEVEGNVWYKVYRGSTLLTTTKERRYIDKNVKTGTSYYYYIQTCKYSTSSSKKSAYCNVDIYYKGIDISELCNNVEKYRKDYISISYLKREAQYFKGSDLYMLCKKINNGKTYYLYLVFENYYGWDWDDGKGIKDRNVTSITAKGIVSTMYDSRYNKGTIPVITLYRVHWEY